MNCRNWYALVQVTCSTSINVLVATVEDVGFTVSIDYLLGIEFLLILPNLYQGYIQLSIHVLFVIRVELDMRLR